MVTSIRKGNFDDLVHVHGLVRELAIYEKAEHEFIATLEDYQNDFRAGVFEVLLAETEGIVIGMCLYYLSYSTWKGKMLYLEDFVVKQSYRQEGVGQQLFGALIQEAKQKRCRLIKWQVLDWNEAAIKFYEKNNAVIEQEWWNGKIIF